jgi:hypothetical protein
LKEDIFLRICQSSSDNPFTQPDAFCSHPVNCSLHGKTKSFSLCPDQNTDRTCNAETAQSRDAPARCFINADCLNFLIKRKLDNRCFSLSSAFARKAEIVTGDFCFCKKTAESNSAVPNPYLPPAWIS